MSASLALLAAATLAPPGADVGLARQAVFAFKRHDIENPNPPLQAEVTLTVSPDGRVIQCVLGETRGDPEQTARVCDVARELRYTRKATVDGKAAYGRIRTILTAFDETSRTIRNEPMLRLGPQLVLEVNKLPAKADRQFDVPLTVLVSPEGKVIQCVGRSDDPINYVNIGCEQLAGINQEVIVNEAGEPVPFVTVVPVRFTLLLRNNIAAEKEAAE